MLMLRSHPGLHIWLLFPQRLLEDLGADNECWRRLPKLFLSFLSCLSSSLHYLLLPRCSISTSLPHSLLFFLSPSSLSLGLRCHSYFGAPVVLLIVFSSCLPNSSPPPCLPAVFFQLFLEAPPASSLCLMNQDLPTEMLPGTFGPLRDSSLDHIALVLVLCSQ